MATSEGQPLSSGLETYFERHPRRVTSALNALGVALWESEVGTTAPSPHPIVVEQAEEKE